MIYTALTKKALRIAFDAHKDQVDKTGLPYVFHPYHLAEQMETEDEVCIALLHDVVEDSTITIDDLRAEGFSGNVIDALVLLTHDCEKKSEYTDYIREIKTNPLATKVKLADLRHNSDETRVDDVDGKMLLLWEKYRNAIELLEKPLSILERLRRLEGEDDDSDDSDVIDDDTDSNMFEKQYSEEPLFAHSSAELEEIINSKLTIGDRKITVIIKNTEFSKKLLERVQEIAEHQYSKIYQKSCRVGIWYNEDKMIFKLDFIE